VKSSLKFLNVILWGMRALIALLVVQIVLGFFGINFRLTPDPEAGAWAKVQAAQELNDAGKHADAVAAINAWQSELQRKDLGGDGELAEARYYALMLRGDAHVRMGRGDLAPADFASAGRMDYDSWDSSFGMGWAYSTMPEGCGGVTREFRRAVKKRSGPFYDKKTLMPRYYRIKADCHAVAGEYELALQELEHEIDHWKSTRADPVELAEARGLRALYWVSAYRMLDHVIEHNRGYGYPRALHLDGAVRAKQLREWRAEFRQRALESARLLTSSPSGTQLLAKARSLALAGKPDAARAALDKAVQDPAVRAMPEYWIAKAESDLPTHGANAARKSIAQARILRPNHKEAALFLERLKR
jgi:hypothetical protein